MRKTMTVYCDSFTCSIPDAGFSCLTFNREVTACASVAGISGFSAGYWNSAVPSVAASALYIGDVFGIKAGIASYYYHESAFAYSLCIVVRQTAPACRTQRKPASRFHRHAAPMLRHFSCGHLTRKCAALTL